LNLCKNAVEAMPYGGYLMIAGFVRATDRVVVLKVTDTDANIPDGLDAFQLFVTTKPGDTTLGLPIVAQIIAAHRGQIRR
jgi:signal transduction histidine kinase